MPAITYVSGTSHTAKNSWIIIYGWGGGGAGGGNSTAADGGGGGGGGAFATIVDTGLTIDTAYDFSLGAAGTPSAGNDGGNGGDTTWRTNVLIAKGGAGGKAPVSGNGGLPGDGGLAASCTPSTGAFNGGYGSTGRDHNTGRGGHGGSSAGFKIAGYGTSALSYALTYPTASTPAGAGYGGDGGSDGAAGSAPAQGNGGGGGGAGDTAGTANAGGAGAIGKLVIYETPPSFLLCLGCG